MTAAAGTASPRRRSAVTIMNIRMIGALLSLLVLAGCAAGPELRALRAAPATPELSLTPFFPQQVHQCGPAALATVLVHSGTAVSPEQLADQIYVPDRQGSLQVELLAATRRHQRVPHRLPAHVQPMLEELRAGRPVLVLQNLGLDRLPVWHYAVLIGYDAEREHFLLRSGTERRLAMDAQKFLASWDRAGRWAMVVATASEPPASADATGWLRSVAPFESLGQLETAAQGYSAAVARWPVDASAWTALGNVRYRQERFDDAEAAYEKALREEPAQWVARNNLVQSLLDRNCAVEARRWTAEAGTPPPALLDTWQATLARLAYARDGECTRAASN